MSASAVIRAARLWLNVFSVQAGEELLSAGNAEGLLAVGAERPVRLLIP
jgi:hypothetical protein